MIKISFDDIRDPQKNTEDRPTVRDVSLPNNSHYRERREKRANRRMPKQSEEMNIKVKKGSFLSFSFMGWAVVLILLSLVITGFTLFFMGKTTVTIKTKVINIPLSQEVIHTAYKDANEGELPFSIIEMQKTASTTIEATEKKFVKQRASGELIVYNDYSSESQRIIKNTRFEAPDGKIYRVKNSFVVPGRRNGKPGSVVVTVYADQPGEEYNKKEARFTIPGLKGSPRFEKFWAKTKTPLIGGFSGTKPVVDEQVINSKQKELTDKLSSDFESAIFKKLPKNSIFFKDAITYKTTSEQLPVENSNNLVLNVTLTAYVAVFDKFAFADELASEANSDININGKKEILNLDDLIFSVLQKDKLDLSSDTAFQFQVSGPAKFNWVIDPKEVKSALAGHKVDEFDSITAKFNGIKDINLSVRPFWKSEFPTNPKYIEVTVEPAE